MLAKLVKLRNNLISARALKTLGTFPYARFLLNSLVLSPQILRKGDLRPVDRSMAKVTNTFHYRGFTFQFDCLFCDQNLDEDSFAFGVVREIYIRDCYSKWLPDWVFKEAKKVVDLGSNRGAFSSAMT